MLIEKNGRVWLSLKVMPGATVDKIVGWQGDDLKIRITAPPEKGRANKKLIAFLAGKLSVAGNAICLEQGQTNSRKVISVTGISRQEVVDRLLN